MNVLADENLHRTIVARLVADGHEVADVGDLAPSITDDEVLALAIERRALLVTNDLDFGELVFVRGARHAGVLVLRLGGMPYADQAAPRRFHDRSPRTKPRWRLLGSHRVPPADQVVKKALIAVVKPSWASRHRVL